MSTDPHVSQSDLRWWATAIIIPGIGLLLSGVYFGTQSMDKLNSIVDKVETISTRQDRQDEKINHINGKVDTIERRQAIYQATHK